MYTFLKNNYPALIILLIAVTFFLKLITVPFIEERHLVLTAKNFLEGRLNFKEPLNISVSDIAYYSGKYYPYTGPFPAVLLMPFVYLFGTSLSQRILTFVIVILSFIAIYRIARKFSLSSNNALLIATFFHFGTVYLFTSAVNITTLEIQSIATGLLVLSLHEFFYKRRWWLIGMILSFAFATRFTTFFAVTFFLLFIVLEKEKYFERIKSLFALSVPIIITLFLLYFYNYVRFGSGFETGYTYNLSFSATPNHEAAEKYGLFSFHHIPVNFFYFLFKGPEIDIINPYDLTLNPPYLKVDQMGMSILFTSPLFIYLIFVNWKNELTKFAIITSMLIFVPSLMYFGIGHSQFGYRYALDFYPFLIILLISVFQKIGLPKFANFLIIYSVFFDAYFLYSIWGIYPFK